MGYNIGMTQEKILSFLQEKFPNQKIKFFGFGSDSDAFRIGDKIIRVPHNENNIDLYLHEASVCKAIKKFIDFDIPEITVHQDEFLWIEHKIVDGKPWSWHKFMFHPKKQKNLGLSLARFMAQLHSPDVCAAIDKAENIKKYKHVYMPYQTVAPFLADILRPRQLEFFHKHYKQIVSYRVPKQDMVLCHLGIKGPNSVVDSNGNLTGVFDFCNAGIYERWRDMVLIYLFASRNLYKTFCCEYKRLTGITVNTKRISDLAAIEYLWAKRWYKDDKIIPLNRQFVARNTSSAMAYFHKLPKFMKWWWYYTKK